MPRKKHNNDGAGERPVNDVTDNDSIPPPWTEDEFMNFIPEGIADDTDTRLEAAIHPPAYQPTEPEPPPSPRATAESAGADNNNPSPVTHTAPPQIAPQPATPKTDWGGLILKSAISGLVMASVGDIFDDDVF